MRAKQSLNMLCLLAALLLALPLSAASAVDVDERMAGHQLVAENSALRLYADPATLSIVLEETAGGRRLYSTQKDEQGRINQSWKGLMQSGFAVEYFNDRTPTPQRIDAINGKPEIAFTALADGFDAQVHYAELGISLLLQLRLDAGGIRVSVPADSLKEGEGVRLSGLYLYPFMGATKLGETEGYMLVPEGSGALISLKNNQGKYKTPYQKRVYGDNLGTRKQSVALAGKWLPREPAKILAPFFGMAHTDRELAYLAYVEEGQFNADILAYPNGAITEYNWIAARFIYREQYNMPTTRTRGILTSEKTPYFRDISLRFELLLDEEADYTGMARAYRDHLINRGLTPKEGLGLYTRVDFLGADTQKTLLGDTAAVATTFSEAGDILAQLKANGLKAPLVIFKGWQTGGLSKNLGSGDFAPEGKLGGMGDLRKLAATARDGGGAFFLEQDFLHANPTRRYNTNRDLAKSVSQAIMFTQTGNTPYDSLYYLTPGRAYDLAARYQAVLGKEKFGVSVDALPNNLFSYDQYGAVHSRGEAADGFLKALGALGGAAVALDQPFDYLWDRMDVLLDLPLYTSNYNFFQAEVPFLPIALHGLLPYYAGYMNFEPNNREFFLKMMEYGAYPSFLLTTRSPAVLKNTNSSDVYSSQFSVYHQTILAYAAELYDFFSRVESARIFGHSILAPGVVRVSYDNGLMLFVNYGEEAYQAGDAVIPARSYLVIEE